MTQTDVAFPTESHWGGGTSPFGVPWQKLMMWIFIISDALLFAGFLAAYGFLRLASPTWPHQADVFDLNLITLMTFVLISSSVFMAMGVAAAHHGKQKDVTRSLLLTMLGGLVFLGIQAYEWTHLIGQGASLTSNPWDVPLFSASFFVITGFHGTHVFSGVILLFITVVRTRLGRSTPRGIENVGLYWHFVDLVWVFIFTFFYLI